MTPEEQALCDQINNDLAYEIKESIFNYIKENNGQKDSIEVADHFQENYPTGIVYMAIDMLDDEGKLGWNGEGIIVKEC